MEQIIFFKEIHIEQFENIEKRFFSSPWTKKNIKESLENDYCIFLAYDIDEILAGYIGLYIIEEEAEIITFAVNKEFQQKGIGSKLMLAAKKFLKSKAASSIFLDVRESNFSAINLYKKFGFKLIGKRKDFYQKPLENSLLYKCDLL